jgi:hypothetical protein
MTPQQAINRAFWTIRVPSTILVLGPMIAVYLLLDKDELESGGGATLFVVTFIGGLIVGWLIWSLLIPRWRLWAYERVDNIPELKRRAVAAQLIWPPGHFFERTEIASKTLRERIYAVETTKHKHTSKRQV